MYLPLLEPMAMTLDGSRETPCAPVKDHWVSWRILFKIDIAVDVNKYLKRTINRRFVLC